MTNEELLAKVEADHGIEAARVAARFIAKEDGDLPDRFSHREKGWDTSGRKARGVPKGIPLSRSKGTDWKDRNELRSLNNQKRRPLPRSGAPVPPARAPRDIEGC